jgi:hypothetical protein
MMEERRQMMRARLQEACEAEKRMISFFKREKGLEKKSRQFEQANIDAIAKKLKCL